MTEYRVVSEGAVVRWPNGRTSANLLPPGTVIEGKLMPFNVMREPKRRKGYADKRIVPAEDKAL